MLHSGSPGLPSSPNLDAGPLSFPYLPKVMLLMSLKCTLSQGLLFAAGEDWLTLEHRAAIAGAVSIFAQCLNEPRV